jgi:hypothetical protein
MVKWQSVAVAVQSLQRFRLSEDTGRNIARLKQTSELHTNAINVGLTQTGKNIRNKTLFHCFYIIEETLFSMQQFRLDDR